jgi:hypothetical protein
MLFPPSGSAVTFPPIIQPKIDLHTSHFTLFTFIIHKTNDLRRLPSFHADSFMMAKPSPCPSDHTFPTPAGGH